LESAVAAGHIRFYGAATWNAFRLDEKEVGFLSLNECLAIAREVAGKAHHFRFVQLPFNLAMVEALGRPNQSVNGRQVPMVEAARELNVALIASASLMQGQVARNLPSFVGQVFGCENDLHAALQFVRSTPGITAALVGMGRPEHAEFNLKLVGSSPAPFEQYVKLFGQSE
jgi:aryl-alcohol dehydrogenase-like predicted oxidoreductase